MILKWATAKWANPKRRIRKGIRSGLCLFVGSWLFVMLTAVWPGGRAPYAVASPPAVSPAALSLVSSHQAIAAALPDISADVSAGLSAFERGQTARAIAAWQSALSELGGETDDQALTRAYLLSNLATAYRQLGDLDRAQAALDAGLLITNTWAAPTATYWEVSARLLNAQGQSQWHRGQTRAALNTWQQAEAHYRAAIAAGQEAPLGLVLAQVNQAIALQELGFNAEAALQLNQLGDQITAMPPDSQLATVQTLGKALRSVGDLQAARDVLSKGLTLVAATQTPRQRRGIELELAHTMRALSHRAIAIGQGDAANDYAERALDYYVVAAVPIQGTSVDFGVTQAQLNQLSYLIEIGQLDAARLVGSQIDLSGLPTGRSSVEAHISYAHSLGCLRSPLTTACTKREWQDADSNQGGSQTSATTVDAAANSLMLDTLTNALQQAKALSDPLLETYALGELGHLYELNGQGADAIRLTRQALALLEGQQLPEVAYLWEWQLARLYQQSPAQPVALSPVDKQGEGVFAANQAGNQAAIAAYQQAIASLAAVRQNLLLVDPQVQFSFRDNVEPVYREFISLLLQSGSADAPPDQQSLRLAVQTMDALQLTELENFLGCNLSQLVSLTATDGDPGAAKLYPLVLPDQLAVIVDIPAQPLTLRSVSIPQQTVERTLKSLRSSLTLPGKTPAVLSAAQDLYGWLIEPIVPILAENPQLETLVFVPDGPLRNIPMGVLYDGEQYLIEKDYAIAIAPQLDLFSPRPAPAPLKVLRGGIGLPQTVRGQVFPPIELVQAELNQIPDSFTVSQPLINEDFTQSNIEQQLSNETYSAIHWKTHGVFSSNPVETFLVAYQEGITANELSTLVRTATQQQAEPLEMLVLSACATAQGDRRAVLGLAGIAVRAGTRSTLSTLWRADDVANTELMASFYEGLSQGMTKAQSLQSAQKMLLNESGYPAPYYWAPYVLVGNWL